MPDGSNRRGALARVLRIAKRLGMSIPRIAAAVAALIFLGAPAAADWYGARGVPPPVGSRVYVCHGYGCRIVTPVTLTGAEISLIASPFEDAGDAVAERAALARAVQSFEEIVGVRVGTGGDRPRTQIGEARSDQMDCIDEATNTTSLLKLLATQGALRHHNVGKPAARGFFLDGRYPHATAVIAEAGGAKWAVDSWPRANAEPPVIQPLAKWLRSREAIPSEG
jgi:hypothetical protein